MTERNAIFKRAFKCKNSDFSIREDLPPELVDLRNKHLDIRKEILKVNPTALVSVTSRSYLPVNSLYRNSGQLVIAKYGPPEAASTA